MNSEWIRGTITELGVVSEYNGSVYEQTVRIRLAGGTEIDLFDGRAAIEPKMVGESGEFVILALPETLEGSAITVEPGIFPAENPSSDWSYEFHGEIHSINTEDQWFQRPHENLLTIDIGIGFLLVKSTQSIRDQISTGRLSEGSFVCLSSTRTDLVELHTD